VSLFVFALYYSFLVAGEELAQRGFVPPSVSMWAANVVFAIAGIALASRMGRESGSARGGGLGELLYSLAAGAAPSRRRRLTAPDRHPTAT
jgi:hypothetical protein